MCFWIVESGFQPQADEFLKTLLDDSEFERYICHPRHSRRSLISIPFPVQTMIIIFIGLISSVRKSCINCELTQKLAKDTDNLIKDLVNNSSTHSIPIDLEENDGYGKEPISSGVSTSKHFEAAQFAK